MTGQELAVLFCQLTECRPEMAEWFDQKRAELTEGLDMWGGPIDMKTPTASEKEAVEGQAQAYCCRISSVIQGLSHIAAFDFPELAGRFRKIATDAFNVLADYKAALANGTETEENVKKTFLLPESLRQVEKAMSTE